MNDNFYIKLNNLIKDHASQQLKIKLPDEPDTSELLREMFEGENK